MGHYKCFSLYLKMSETSTYYERNIEAILNRAKEYYENNKEILKEQERNRFRELSEDEKIIKRENGRNRYYNMSQEKKQRLKKYRKKLLWSWKISIESDWLFPLHGTKMEQNILGCVNKYTFHKNVKPINTYEVNIRRIVISSKHSYGNKESFKYLTGYISNAGIILLYIKLPQMNTFVKYFDNW